MQTRISTKPEDEYTYLEDNGIPSNGCTFITFQVQTCSDAHIAVSPKLKGEIEIVIGGNNNTLSFIRIISQGIRSETAYGPVLDCRELCPFTTYWGDGQILLKKGDTTAAKSNIFLNLSLTFNLDDVKVGISTGSFGNWVFESMFICLAINQVKENGQCLCAYNIEFFALFSYMIV